MRYIYDPWYPPWGRNLFPKRKHLVGPLERWNGHRQVCGVRQAQGWDPAAVGSLGKLSDTSVLYLLPREHRRVAGINQGGGWRTLDPQSLPAASTPRGCLTREQVFELVETGTAPAPRPPPSPYSHFQGSPPFPKEVQKVKTLFKDTLSFCNKQHVIVVLYKQTRAL